MSDAASFTIFITESNPWVGAQFEAVGTQGEFTLEGRSWPAPSTGRSCDMETRCVVPRGPWERQQEGHE